MALVIVALAATSVPAILLLEMLFVSEPQFLTYLRDEIPKEAHVAIWVTAYILALAGVVSDEKEKTDDGY